MRASLLLLLLAGVVLGQTPAPALRASMIALGVTDMARSVRFYSEVLGLELAGKPGEVTLVKAGDLTIALNRPLGRSGQVVGAVEVIFRVESVSAAFEGLAGRGCVFVRDPREVTAGTWAATFTDPDGHRLTILGAR